MGRFPLDFPFWETSCRRRSIRIPPRWRPRIAHSVPSGCPVTVRATAPQGVQPTLRGTTSQNMETPSLAPQPFQLVLRSKAAVKRISARGSSCKGSSCQQTPWNCKAGLLWMPKGLRRKDDALSALTSRVSVLCEPNGIHKTHQKFERRLKKRNSWVKLGLRGKERALPTYAKSTWTEGRTGLCSETLPRKMLECRQNLFAERNGGSALQLEWLRPHQRRGYRWRPLSKLPRRQRMGPRVQGVLARHRNSTGLEKWTRTSGAFHMGGLHKQSLQWRNSAKSPSKRAVWWRYHKSISRDCSEPQTLRLWITAWECHTALHHHAPEA